MNVDGYGPVIKAISIAYLSYMVVFRNCKVPVLFFVLFGIGSLASVTHLLMLKKTNAKQVDAGNYDQYQYFNITLCLLTIFVIMNK
jgi:hypothetical protein